MLSNLDADDLVNLGRIVGLVLVGIAFLLPGVHDGATVYHGWACAAWTLYGTIAFFARLFSPDGPDGWGLFFMISGWITPMALIGAFIESKKAKRRMAGILPVLLVAPWIVFAWPNSGWGALALRPSVGHSVWTAGCLLIFTPEYRAFFAGKRKGEEMDAE
jgi:hypothetical protein